MVGAKRKSLSGLGVESDGARICPDCGDLMPLYSRICPFCHYINSDDRAVQFDHESSPILMFRDLVSYSKQIVNLKMVSRFRGVARAISGRDIEPSRVELLELEATFWVIYDSLVYGRFINDQSMFESVESVRIIVEGALQERAERERAIKRLTTCIIALVALIVVAVFALNLLFL